MTPGVEHYLGDGLYVSHDGCGQICLRADGNRVYLEPSVWYELLGWVKRWQAAEGISPP
jgi:hypothetical protein